MEIGKRIKLIREEKNIELSDIAARSGLDQQHLEKIESGEIAPAIGTLIKLARIFGVRLGTFLDDDKDKGIVVIRSKEMGEGLKLSASGKGPRDNLSFVSLAREKSNRHMDPFLIEVSQETPVHRNLSSHEGEEFIYVLQGSIEVIYGNKNIILETGDSLYYDSVVGHQVRANKEQKALILAVVYLPI